VLEARVLDVQPPQHFSAVVESLNDALLRLWLDDLPLRATRDLNIWLSAYDVPADRVAEFRARWMDLVRRLYPGAGVLP
jgi:hypothetical protein